MRKGIVLWFLLLSFVVRGQDYSYYLVTKNNLRNTSYYCSRSNPASVQHQQGTINILDVNSNTLSSNDVQQEFTTRPSKYIVNAGRCRWIEGSNRGSTYNLGGFTITIPTNLDSYYEIKTNYNSSSLYFEKINIQQINELTCNTTSINAANGIVDSNIENWEYIIGGQTFILNNSEGVSSVPFEFDNFDVDLNNYIGQTIFFRYKLVGGLYSYLKPYTIISCSPQLVENGFSSTNTSCSYTDDGGFSMILDRQIPENKKLVVSLFFENEFIADDYNLLTQKVTEELIGNGNGTYTYLWPDDTPIKKGNYKVRYQTLDTSVDNPIWDSLEGTEDGFTINGPSSLIFSLSLENNVNCFNGSDGRIKVSSYGGSGGYKYFFEGNVVPFSNTGVGTQAAPINQIITGLSSGQKNIKVQDVNNCEEQN